MKTLNKYLHCYNYINKQRGSNNKIPPETVINRFQKDKSIFKDPFITSNYN